MPLYNYKCQECDKTEEHLSKVGDKEKPCECGDVAIKVFTANASMFQVNGAGAYNSGKMKSK